MKVNEAAFFGYPVTDLPRARKFYEGVLGLKHTGERPIPWIEYDLGNATLGLGAYGSNWAPSKDGAMLALEVDDFEKSVSELKKASVPFHMEATETPVCHFAIIRDPDGNALMIHKRKPGHN